MSGAPPIAAPAGADAALSLVAEIRARPGRGAELGALLRGLVAPTRAEEGCLDYALHAAPQDGGHFVFYENWATEACWERHMASPHLAAFRARSDDLVAEFRLLRLRRVA